MNRNVFRAMTFCASVLLYVFPRFDSHYSTLMEVTGTATMVYMIVREYGL